MKKILIAFGTRPEAIKMAPIINEFKINSDIFDTKICVTGQHREMLDQVLDFFSINPDYDLNLMKPGQDLFNLTADIILGMKEVFLNFKPDYVFVHGDTTTTLAVSLASFYSECKVCHIEAGLRTNNIWSPFPEEVNRQITSRISSYHFAPTQNAKRNLLKENIPEKNIIVTGNTVIDVLLNSISKVIKNPSSKIKKLSNILGSKDIILVTGHRRENHGIGFVRICNALLEIARIKPNVLIIYPVHLNPNVQKPVYDILKNKPNIHLIDPLEYKDFIWLLNRSKLIITDSGGIQEEAPSLGKPVLLMRETTERPEAVEAGTVILVGTNENRIVSEVLELLNDSAKFEKMSKLHNPYGDGKASKRVVEFLAGINE